MELRCRDSTHGAMGRWIDPLGGTIEVFLLPASFPRLIQQNPWCVLSCLWYGVYKKSLADILRAWFPLSPSDPFPHI